MVVSYLLFEMDSQRNIKFNTSSGEFLCFEEKKTPSKFEYVQIYNEKIHFALFDCTLDHYRPNGHIKSRFKVTIRRNDI